MDSLKKYVQEIARNYRAADSISLPAPGERSLPSPAPDAPLAIIFSPHPDDEMIIGGWPLRLRVELGWRVVNFAVTLGSDKSRQTARLEELTGACRHVGFVLKVADDCGLERIRLETRRKETHHWIRAVDLCAIMIQTHQPKLIFHPHAGDGHPTHAGVCGLIQHALVRIGNAWKGHVAETEFWAPMEAPDLLVESSEAHVATLLEGLSFHVGEVTRNPYHLRMPAWMMDNVRRAGERMAGAGEAPPNFLFGTPYRLRYWSGGSFEEVIDQPRAISLGDNADAHLKHP